MQGDKKKEHIVLWIVLVSFALLALLAPIILIPNFFRAKEKAKQRSLQTSRQISSKKYSSSLDTKKKRRASKVKKKSARETSLEAIAEIERKIAEIKSYRVDFKSKIIRKGKSATEKEGYGISLQPDNLKVKLTNKVKLIDEAKFNNKNKFSLQQTDILIDRTNLWQLKPDQKTAYSSNVSNLSPAAKEITAGGILHFSTDIGALKETLTNGSAKLKRTEYLNGEKIFAIELSFQSLKTNSTLNFTPFAGKILSYLSAENGLPKMNIFYNKRGKEIMTIFLKFSRINQISKDEFNILPDWEIVDIRHNR